MQTYLTGESVGELRRAYDFRRDPSKIGTLDAALTNAGVYRIFGDAFAYDGKGILIAGASGAGKTTLVRKFQEQEPEKIQFAVEDRPYFFADGLNKPSLLFANDLGDLLEGDVAGVPLEAVVHLDFERGSFYLADVPYREAINDGFGVPPESRIADSCKNVRFVRSGMVARWLVLHKYRTTPMPQKLFLMIEQPRVSPDADELHIFYEYLKGAILTTTQ
jgi:hypothetical protein